MAGDRGLFRNIPHTCATHMAAGPEISTAQGVHVERKIRKETREEAVFSLQPISMRLDDRKMLFLRSQMVVMA